MSSLYNNLFSTPMSLVSGLFHSKSEESYDHVKAQTPKKLDTYRQREEWAGIIDGTFRDLTVDEAREVLRIFQEHAVGPEYDELYNKAAKLVPAEGNVAHVEQEANVAESKKDENPPSVKHKGYAMIPGGVDPQLMERLARRKAMNGEVA